jgi:hypothetical protein
MRVRESYEKLLFSASPLSILLLEHKNEASLHKLFLKNGACQKKKARNSSLRNCW